MESFDELSYNLNTFHLQSPSSNIQEPNLQNNNFSHSNSHQFYNVVKIDRDTSISNGKCEMVFLDLQGVPSLKSNQYLVFFPSLDLWKDQKIFFKTQVSLTNQFFSLPVFNLGCNIIKKKKGDPIGFYTIGTLVPNKPPQSFIDNLQNTLQISNFLISSLSSSNSSLSSQHFSEKNLSLSDKQLSIDPKKSIDVSIDKDLYSNVNQLIIFQDLPIQLLNQIQNQAIRPLTHSTDPPLSQSLDYQHEFLYWIPFKIITNLQYDNQISVLNLQKFSQLKIHNSNVQDQDTNYNLAKVILINNKQFINLSIEY